MAIYFVYVERTFFQLDLMGFRRFVPFLFAPLSAAQHCAPQKQNKPRKQETTEANSARDSV